MLGTYIFLSWIAAVMCTHDDDCVTEETRQLPRDYASKIDLLFAVFRHGERAPLGTFPKDTNKDHAWDYGFGQLTRKGKQTMYKVGKYLRHRYGNFLSDDPREVATRSSPEPRCYESAALLLYGLYPAQGKWVWKYGQDWQPVPITMVPAKNDIYTAHCPKVVGAVVKQLSSSSGEKSSSGAAQMLPLLANVTGIDPTHARKLLDAVDAFLVQDENGLRMPPWYAKHGPLLKTFNDKIYVTLGAALSRNMGGEVLRDLDARIQKLYTKGTNSTQLPSLAPLSVPAKDKIQKKVKLFSLHDLNVIAVLWCLNDKAIKKRPAYGSVVMFEVSRQKDEPYIEVFYRDGTVGEPVLYDITGCPYPCSVATFTAQVNTRCKPITNDECGLPTTQVLL